MRMDQKFLTSHQCLIMKQFLVLWKLERFTRIIQNILMLFLADRRGRRSLHLRPCNITRSHPSAKPYALLMIEMFSASTPVVS